MSLSQRSGVDLIAAERRRQVRAEGYDVAHDDAHDDGELLIAASLYVIRSRGETLPPDAWPWEAPADESDCVRDLVKAAALIAAEIDRIERSR